MFDSLIESRRARERTLTQTIASVVIHTLIFAAAIQLTRAAAQSTRARPTEVEIAFAPDHTPPPPPAAAAQPRSALPSVSAPVSLNLTPPIQIPTTLPPVTAEPAFDPRRYTGSSPGAPDISGERTLDTLDRSFSKEEVDAPAEYVGGPAPRFPSALRMAGIEGSVLLQFVVGTDGKAEPGSVHVVSSTNRAFEDAAVAAVIGGTFRPGKIRGRSVRQVVEQSVRFQLTPDE